MRESAWNALVVCELLEGMHFLLVVLELLKHENLSDRNKQTAIDVHEQNVVRIWKTI
jgi:hypothetical protein